MEDASNHQNRLTATRVGIDTSQESVAYMRDDCLICRAEGFGGQSRVEVSAGDKNIIARLNVVESGTGILSPGYIGLSKVAWERLALEEEREVSVSHPAWVSSLSHVRRKIFDLPLSQKQFNEIVRDIQAGRYTDVHIASFLTACANRLDINEIAYLSRAMVDIGARMTWPDAGIVVDKHCIGGLPGNRTTPILVSIVTAAGLVMPKTSSRSITSPAGTADTMEVLTRVDLDMETIRRVVQEQGGCLAWGGNANLSPVDDILIRVEKAMDLDSEGQLVASVMSKKIAAGSTHILIDIPVGPTAKVRSMSAAKALKQVFERVGACLGVVVMPVITDGQQPIGRGIGPVFEAGDVLAVLQNREDAPADLRERSIMLAGLVLEMVGRCEAGHGKALAQQLLTSGAAWDKFRGICEAQGGLRSLPPVYFRYPLRAKSSGTVTAIDNRKLANLAKLAGAPNAKSAGIRLLAKVGDRVCSGETLLEIWAETQGELRYAQSYLVQVQDMIQLE
ncbi:thymidine phosphorylase family protein [Marinobacterium sediminicola]|uniref:Putative thymidine phosphorylase n=1 Tax=Marinobacterium sediminicola TaxID=518898 RepID=A0ABY1S2S6_9GAMM|nr:thymidine phosphorylase family protein [Marinobacterium sediminicola]ULG68476.1 thymidine phosphorylase family protein [Marinobacterium sediminicola]SMR76754.1 thymidine phosphorylase [Marinobacterium sediminicola]